MYLHNIGTAQRILFSSILLGVFTDDDDAYFTLTDTSQIQSKEVVMNIVLCQRDNSGVCNINSLITLSESKLFFRLVHDFNLKSNGQSMKLKYIEED